MASRIERLIKLFKSLKSIERQEIMLPFCAVCYQQLPPPFMGETWLPWQHGLTGSGREYHYQDQRVKHGRLLG